MVFKKGEHRSVEKRGVLRYTEEEENLIVSLLQGSLNELGFFDKEETSTEGRMTKYQDAFTHIYNEFCEKTSRSMKRSYLSFKKKVSGFIDIVYDLMHIPQDRTVYRVYQTTYDMLKKIADQNPVFDEGPVRSFGVLNWRGRVDDGKTPSLRHRLSKSSKFATGKGQRGERKVRDLGLLSTQPDLNSPGKSPVQKEVNNTGDEELLELNARLLNNGPSQPLLDAPQTLADRTQPLIDSSSQPILDDTSHSLITNTAQSILAPSSQLLGQSNPYDILSSRQQVNPVQYSTTHVPEKGPSSSLPKVFQGPSSHISTYLEPSKQHIEESKRPSRNSSLESFCTDYTAPIVFRDCNITIDAIYNDRGGFDAVHFPTIRNISPIQHPNESEFRCIMNELDQILNLMKTTKRFPTLNVEQNTVSV